MFTTPNSNRSSKARLLAPMTVLLGVSMALGACGSDPKTRTTTTTQQTTTQQVQPVVAPATTTTITKTQQTQP